MKPTVGYVLSGGGARGFAHLGVLQYLEEQNIRPSAIAGVSAGAIAGALYAAGLAPVRVLELLQGSQYFGWSSFAWQRRALFKLDALRKILVQALPEDDFKALKIPLYVGTTDLLQAKRVILHSGKLSTAVAASAAVPLIFEPVLHEGQMPVDGGVLDNFPVDVLQGACNKIVGVHVNRQEPVTDSSLLKSPSVVIDRCFHMAIATGVYAKAKACDLFIDVPLQHIPMFDIKQARNIFDAGYEAAHGQAGTIAHLLLNGSNNE